MKMCDAILERSTHDAGGAVKNRSAFGVYGTCKMQVLKAFAIAMMWFAIAHSASALTPSGTLIQNSASVAFTDGNAQQRTISSNVVLADPVVSGRGALDPLKPISLATTTMLHGGDAAFVQVRDTDQNRDATAIETVQLQLTTQAGDREIVHLSETGVDTGEFVGYIQTSATSAVVGDCVLEVARNPDNDSV
jgi:hypothetical protein